MSAPATPMGRHRAGGPRSPRGSRPPADRPGPECPPETSDTVLVAAVRAGETAAYAQLYARHAAAARRLARVLVREHGDADDLVAEAFARMLATLRSGGGPQVAFRAYLLTAVRHAYYDGARRERRIELTADVSRYTPPEREAAEAAVGRLDRAYAARAFARLPERWRTVLWHTEVEGEKPAAIAARLGLTPNAVATLASRARERLRQMYLQEHLRLTGAASCRWTADRLGAYVRQGSSRRERSKVDAHLAGCRRCRTLWTELAEVNAGLRGVLTPLVLSATMREESILGGTGGVLMIRCVDLVGRGGMALHATCWVAAGLAAVGWDVLARKLGILAMGVERSR